MPKFIFRSNYFKNESKKHKSNFVKYLGTREGVEISSEMKRTDMPKFFFEDQDMHGKKESYVSYISERPGVVKEDGAMHGLFSDKGMDINLEQVMDEVADHEGMVWINVLSLQREDAERLGFDHVEPWQNLLRKHVADIAENFQIEPANLKWYAAFHNESYHPHVHMIVYSENPKEGFLKKAGIENLKSKLTNDIFRNELAQIYSGKTEARTRAKEKARKALQDALKRMKDCGRRMDAGLNTDCNTELNETVHELDEKLKHLSERLKSISGRKVYGYLRKDLKEEVDEIVSLVERIPEVAAAYDAWYKQQEIIEGYYKESPSKRIPMARNKEFRSVANAVIREAMIIGLGNNPSKEEMEHLKEMAQAGDRNAQSVLKMLHQGDSSDRKTMGLTRPILRLLKSLEQVMNEKSLGEPKPRYLCDKKAMRKEREKRIALGEKAESHSETNSAGMRL